MLIKYLDYLNFELPTQVMNDSPSPNFVQLIISFDEELHFAIYTRRVHHRAPVIPNKPDLDYNFYSSKLFFFGENVIWK